MYKGEGVNFRGFCPAVSGCVRVILEEPDRLKASSKAGLRESVRLVRQIFNSLT